MKKEEMNTMVECIQMLKQKGFTKDFIIRDGFLLFDNDTHKYGPEEVKIETFFRFEGNSDPADNAILYGITTSDGFKGIVSDAYGAYADIEIGKFISQVESISKKEAESTE